MQKIGQATYASAGAGGSSDGQADGQQSQPQDESTIKGEFREV